MQAKTYRLLTFIILVFLNSFANEDSFGQPSMGESLTESVSNNILIDSVLQYKFSSTELLDSIVINQINTYFMTNVSDSICRSSEWIDKCFESIGDTLSNASDYNRSHNLWDKEYIYNVEDLSRFIKLTDFEEKLFYVVVKEFESKAKPYNDNVLILENCMLKVLQGKSDMTKARILFFLLNKYTKIDGDQISLAIAKRLRTLIENSNELEVNRKLNWLALSTRILATKQANYNIVISMHYNISLAHGIFFENEKDGLDISLKNIMDIGVSLCDMIPGPFANQQTFQNVQDILSLASTELTNEDYFYYYSLLARTNLKSWREANLESNTSIVSKHKQEALMCLYTSILYFINTKFKSSSDKAFYTYFILQNLTNFHLLNEDIKISLQYGYVSMRLLCENPEIINKSNLSETMTSIIMSHKKLGEFWEAENWTSSFNFILQEYFVKSGFDYLIYSGVDHIKNYQDDYEYLDSIKKSGYWIDEVLLYHVTQTLRVQLKNIAEEKAKIQQYDSAYYFLDKRNSVRMPNQESFINNMVGVTLLGVTQAHKHEQEVRAKRLIITVGTLIILVLIIIALSMSFWKQKKIAKESEKKAIEAKEEELQAKKEALYLKNRAEKSERNEKLLSETMRQLGHTAPTTIRKVISHISLPPIPYKVLVTLSIVLNSIHQKFRVPSISFKEEARLVNDMISLRYINRHSIMKPTNQVSYSFSNDENCQIPSFVLLNLVLNAFEHGNIWVDPKIGAIRVSLDKNDDWLILKVTNPIFDSDEKLMKDENLIRESSTGLKFIKGALEYWNNSEEEFFTTTYENGFFIAECKIKRI